MIGQFELFVAFRYLRAKRKHAAVSVITVISILGVAAGVMALIIALSISNGFRSTLQKSLLGATAHVSVLEKEPGAGIENWRDLAAKLRQIPHVTNVAPSLYAPGVMFSGPLQSAGGILKGVDPATAAQQAEMLTRLKSGRLERLKEEGLPGVILGAALAENAGMLQDSVVQITLPTGDMTPFGPRPATHQFRVVGIYESGFYELDSTWAYITLETAQKILGVQDVVNSLELRVDDIYKAPEVARQAESVAGSRLAATHWQEQNKPILNALQMEKIVFGIVLGLIQVIAALNILIALIMAVMEKYRDIAILMAMGARHQQIRNIFVMQGVLIGVVGSVIGLALGYSLSYLADRYRWIQLDAQVYMLGYVPFDPNPLDAIWVAGVAIAVSFVATLYPARNATRIVPVEALRYE